MIFHQTDDELIHTQFFVSKTIMNLQVRDLETVKCEINSNLVTSMTNYFSKNIFLFFFSFAVVTSTVYGPDPKVITCPSCGKLVTTRIDYESSSKTHLMAVILCLLIWPCFCK